MNLIGRQESGWVWVMKAFLEYTSMTGTSIACPLVFVSILLTRACINGVLCCCHRRWSPDGPSEVEGLVRAIVSVHIHLLALWPCCDHAKTCLSTLVGCQLCQRVANVHRRLDQLVSNHLGRSEGDRSRRRCVGCASNVMLYSPPFALLILSCCG